MKLDLAIQMVEEDILAQKSRQSAKWTGKVTNTSKYISVNAEEPGNSSGRTPNLKVFFSKVLNTVESPRMRPKVSKRATHSNYA